VRGPDAKPLDPSTVYSLQIMLSKFEVDGGWLVGLVVAGGLGCWRWAANTPAGICTHLFAWFAQASVSPGSGVRGCKLALCNNMDVHGFHP
jgi:hypothetical protein